MALTPLGNSDHVAVSVSTDFPSYSQRDAPFHRIAYHYLRADWDGLPDDLKDVPWENIFKLSASDAASDFVSGFRLELMYISLIESIRSSLTHLHGFQQLVLLPYFIEIPFFVCTKRIDLLNLKYISDTLVIVANGFLKLPNLHMLIRVHHFPETWLSGLLANCQLCLQQR